MCLRPAAGRWRVAPPNFGTQAHQRLEALLISFNVRGRDAPVGLNESFDVNFGANSDRTVLLFNLGSLCDNNGFLRDHPDSE